MAYLQGYVISIGNKIARKEKYTYKQIAHNTFCTVCAYKYIK